MPSPLFKIKFQGYKHAGASLTRQTDDKQIHYNIAGMLAEYRVLYSSPEDAGIWLKDFPKTMQLCLEKNLETEPRPWWTVQQTWAMARTGRSYHTGDKRYTITT